MKSFATRAFRVAFDDSGLTAVNPTARPDRGYFDRLEIGALRRNGEPVLGDTVPAVLDSDEIEQRWLAPDVASIAIRHSFIAGWRTRVVLANLAAADWTATLRFAVRPGPGYRVWTLATGSATVFALLPWEPDVPILYARSGNSSVVSEAADHPDHPTDDLVGLQIGPYRIGAGERLVLSWDWKTASHPRRLASDLSAALPALPRWPCVAVGEEIWLPADPDTALVVPDTVETTDLGDRQALAATEPGRHRVELRSARGSTVLDLSWVTPLPDFLANAAEQALAAPAGPAGVVRLPDLASALVVQRVARTAGFPAAGAAADALDQFTARLNDAGPDPALRAIYLAGEYDRLGDADLISRALDVLAGLGRPVPGLGLAVLRTTVASVLAGRSPPPAPRIVPTGEPETLAEAELLLATRTPEFLTTDPGVSRLLHRLATEVCAGLPGRLPEPPSNRPPLDEIAHTLAVLRLVPDALGPWWTTRFGGPVGELSDARGLEVIERIGAGGPISAAHVWLALSC